ncbi:hypothetical protein T484DRAFT_3554022 [Baffinella frigidus]|nr:hypothetical protein T484DRAFT_3554022 [Cryptophyta sp. CCMP2293]
MPMLRALWWSLGGWAVSYERGIPVGDGLFTRTSTQRATKGFLDGEQPRTMYDACITHTQRSTRSRQEEKQAQEKVLRHCHAHLHHHAPYRGTSQITNSPSP